MLPKLQAFYHKALLPELASPREGKCPGIREPGIWFVPPVKEKQGRCKKRKSQTAGNPRRRKRASKRCETSDSDSADTITPGLALSHHRSTRQRPTKFLGRSINHEWVVDEDSQKKEWYKGTVISLLSGIDGAANALYEVLYEGEDGAYEIDHLVQDYQAGSVQFCDI